MILYSCAHDGDQYRITKWDEDMNVQSSYLCTTKECECPAGSRPMCRHREMLPQFIDREGAIGKGWFLDYDNGGWYEPFEAEEPEPAPMPPLPEGVTMLTLDDPALVHNTIAEAVGEPEAIIQPHSTAVSASDFDSEDGGSNPPVVAKPINIRRW